MTKFEDGQTPKGLAFSSKSEVLGPADVVRAMRRMAHEIVERNQGAKNLVLLGLYAGGVAIAERLAAYLSEISVGDVAWSVLDVAFYRDDLATNPLVTSAPPSLTVDVNDCVVVLVDDVLFTGRTIRAALQALNDWGRPAAVQLAVLVDRGHRELPIRPDFVGKNIPTARHESILATLDGVWIGTKEVS